MAIEDDVKNFSQLADEIKQLLSEIPAPPHDAAAQQKIDEVTAKLQVATDEFDVIRAKLDEASKEHEVFTPCNPGDKEEAGKYLAEVLHAFKLQEDSLVKAVEDSNVFVPAGSDPSEP